MRCYLAYLFIFIYFILSIIHLYHSYIDDKEKRKKTKPFLILALLLYYICATKNISLLVIFTLICCSIGDIALTKKGHKYFVIGGISFLIAHILLIFLYSKRIILESIYWPVTILIMLLYLYGIYKTMKLVKNNISNKMMVAMVLYLACNFIMNTFAIMQLQSDNSLGEFIIVFAALLFFISDCALFIVRYSGKDDIVYHNHFFVMLTYLLSMLLICKGILILGI